MRPLALLLPAVLALPAWGTPLEVWTRPTDGAPAKQRVDPEALELSAQLLADPQYGPNEKRWYRAVPLEAVFKVAPPKPGANLALLRFENGMIIPVRVGQPAELKKLDAWIAVATSDKAPDKGGKFVADFETVARAGATKARERRPLEFHGNKLVVTSGWHPMVAGDAASTFNPWAHADTLLAVEYVNEQAWYRQFAPSDAEALPGSLIFRGRCQFCHGVSNVGANYGWDFVDPYPVYLHRTPDSLSMHLRHREQDAPEKGLMMPAFPELKKPDIEAVWKWLEAVGKQGPLPYRLK